MWYEVIPTMVIIMAGLGLPHHIAQYLSVKFFDTPRLRVINDHWDILMYTRDSRLCDHPMTAGKMGLENIPDE
ncbi:hypothetical protein M0802_003087 [Mischocyttarus mexicanus]|nr:hypothetical protein M0802_003087 [Mischocyttarus mexicanus]